MIVTDGSFLFNYNNLYSSRRTVNTKQSQFSQTVASNNLSTSGASGSTPTFTLYKDAAISYVSVSGASTHVFYDEESGMYKVKGSEADGTEYETLVDVSKVDPRNASRTEMATLAAYLNQKDDKIPVSFMLSGRREMDAYFSLSPNEQKNYKWKSVFTKENQYDDLNYIAQGFYKAGAMEGYLMVGKLTQNIKNQVDNF